MTYEPKLRGERQERPRQHCETKPTPETVKQHCAAHLLLGLRCCGRKLLGGERVTHGDSGMQAGSISVLCFFSRSVWVFLGPWSV